MRQDYLLGEGLLSPYVNGDEDPAAVREMALQRIRQLSAHEIGHTLGLAHNYVASAQTANGTQSVMDYPHPSVRLDGGRIRLGRESYADEIGAWDVVAIRYGYTDFAPGTDETPALDSILRVARDRGVTFLTDQDARPAGSAHPEVHLWDNGASAAAELERTLDVRRAALDGFGEAAVRTGEPLATMEEALVPLYLHHRYQAEATAKVVAGQYYTYALRGDGQVPLRAVSAAEQERALDALMRTLAPAELTIPRKVLDRLPPRPFRYGPHQELFRRHTGPVFDAVAPAAAAADATLTFLLHPERAARPVRQSALDPSLPGLAGVIRRVRRATFEAEVADGYQAEVSRAVERVFVDRLLLLAGRAPMPQVRAVAEAELAELASWLAGAAGAAGAAGRAHYGVVASDIERFRERPHPNVDDPAAPEMPPGSPIGEEARRWLRSGWAIEPVSPDARAVDLTCSWW